MARLDPFTDEQARALIHLEQRYQAWMTTEQVLHALPYDLRRKEISGRAYLYEIADRSGNGRSLGPWSTENQTRFDLFQQEKSQAKARRDAIRPLLVEIGRLCRALRVPLAPEPIGPILREADRRRLLGARLMVVGTNAMTAYAIEAGGFIRDAPDETLDFDLAWTGSDGQSPEVEVWPMLMAVDSTFTINMERTFQARNAKAYEVKVLVAPSRLPTVHQADKPRPVALPEQEWLLLGQPVDRVAICRDASPVRIVAPDPRWFGLHKLWMSAQAKRNPLKRPKDLRQGMALLDTVLARMPQYPLDEDFEHSLPDELRPAFQAWRAQSAPPTASW